MAGYIGKSQSVTQVDGYNRTEADDRYVNASGDTMNGNLSTTGSIKATNGFLAGANNTYLYEGASNILNIRIGETGPYAEFVDAGSGVLEIGNAGGRLSLTSNGIERIHLDDAGRVTMPYQPSFMAYPSTSFNIATEGQVIPFGLIQHNIGSHYNASTYRFTAPVTGVYSFMATFWAPPSTLGAMSFSINGSSANTHTRARVTGTADFEYCTITYQPYLNANDYVECINWQSGTTVHVNYQYNAFSGYLIG